MPADLTRVLEPGSGWSGATAQPDPVGNSGTDGYDKKAIARWNVVPYQTVAGTLQIGVKAYHMAGIDRVEFAVDNGDWVSIDTEAENVDSANPYSVGVASTGTSEYWATIQASNHSDGLIEVRAIAYPVAGVPRVLDSLYLYANSGGSLNPVTRYVAASGGNDSNDGESAGAPKATIEGALNAIKAANGNSLNGSIIYMLAGSYTLDWPNSGTYQAPDRWMTFTAAPGVDAADVIITSTGLRPDGLKKVCVKNLVVNADNVYMVSFAAGDMIWEDGLVVTGSDRSTATYAAPGTAWLGGRYVTNSEISGVGDGPKGALLVRNVRSHTLCSDGFMNCVMVVNCEVDDLNPLETGSHPDVIQLFGGTFENVIIYRLITTNEHVNYSQGIYLESNSFTDAAVIDCDVTVYTAEESGYNFIYGGDMSHVYTRNCYCRGKMWYAMTDVDDVVMEDLTVTDVEVGAARDLVTFR